uniref:Probable carbohydrate esterase At4g34215 n=1 Tax=Nicotiana tabacum TaxID=4097 RepID=A0A1S3XTI6_TOBAC|nr:PREDICTED: probable carbohydrate esterase At4g34215 [Nicotiana tabacum]
MAGQGGVSYGYWDGIVPIESQPNPDNILRFRVNTKWEIAHEPLNYGVDCLSNCGVGPGMAFANAILKKVPNFGAIGLVPCSRVKISLRDGGTLRALLWYHGESDSKDKYTAKYYKSKFEKFVQDLRTELNSPLLPVVVVLLAVIASFSFFLYRGSIGNNLSTLTKIGVVLHHPKQPFVGEFVDVVREAQFDIDLPNVIKVDAKGLPLNSDGIHITTQGQVKLGNMMAEAFLRAKFASAKNNSNKDLSYDVLVYRLTSSFNP